MIDWLIVVCVMLWCVDDRRVILPWNRETGYLVNYYIYVCVYMYVYGYSDGSVTTIRDCQILQYNDGEI